MQTSAAALPAAAPEAALMESSTSQIDSGRRPIGSSLLLMVR